MALATGSLRHVEAAVPADVQAGLDWLQARILADGSLAAEDASIALPHQSRAEAALTLGRLATVPSQLQTAIDGHGSTVTEFLARQAMAAGTQGMGATAVLAALLDARNGDGGFGAAIGFASNSVDTAFVLRALAAQQPFRDSTAEAARAIGYLAGVSISGGWGLNGQPNVQATALALLAVQDWRTVFSVGATTQAAYDWLLAARSSGAYGNVLDDALGLLALATQTSDTTVLQPLATALRAAQSADGSWAGDPYLTALALRALWALDSQPPVATTGGVSGVVADHGTGLPVAGATVQLLELPAMSAATGDDGSFVLSGIAPGTYSLRLARIGYDSVTATVDVKVGQVINVGTVVLTPATLTATVTGTVNNQLGRALSGALVSVGTANAVTDAAGKYVLSGIPPGSAVITATLSGYTSATSEPVPFEAGRVYTFSPTLYNGTPPAPLLRGKVVDGTTSTGISGASLTLGSLTAVTAADGTFSFSGVSAGSFSLGIAAPGYDGATVSGVLVAGTNDLGVLALTKPAASSRLSGRVLDAQTGEAIAGATIAVQSLTTTSEADGSFAIAGITGTVPRLALFAWPIRLILSCNWLCAF